MTNHIAGISLTTGVGTIFSVGGTKISEKNNQGNQIQNVTLCNMNFSEKVYAVYSGVGSKTPRSLGSFREFLC